MKIYGKKITQCDLAKFDILVGADDDDEYDAGELQAAGGVQLCLLAILCQVIVGADRSVVNIYTQTAKLSVLQ